VKPLPQIPLEEIPNDPERAAFEQWASHLSILRKPGGDYLEFGTRRAWEGWLARAELSQQPGTTR
jgi:hypothetical protein